MTHYNATLPTRLSREQKNALVWKIEDDYRQSDATMLEHKHYYVRMAIKYYTRNAHSLEDIVARYRTHRRMAKKPVFGIFGGRMELAQAS